MKPSSFHENHLVLHSFHGIHTKTLVIFMKTNHLVFMNTNHLVFMKMTSDSPPHTYTAALSALVTTANITTLAAPDLTPQIVLFRKGQCARLACALVVLFSSRTCRATHPTNLQHPLPRWPCWCSDFARGRVPTTCGDQIKFGVADGLQKSRKASRYSHLRNFIK